jgi:hypothetical protein
MRLRHPESTPKHELIFIRHLLWPVDVVIVPWKTNRCPPVKRGLFGNILAKIQRINHTSREIEERNQKKSMRESQLTDQTLLFLPRLEHCDH